MTNQKVMLKPTCDRKTRSYPTQKNTFGLLPGLEGTCPYATTAPGGCWHIADNKKLPECYVARTMSVFKGVGPALAHNTQLLQHATQWEMVELLDAEFQRFKKTELRRTKKGQTTDLRYRLHWAGDIFNETYAQALAQAIQLNSDISFWCYTRSFFAVPILCNIPNLILYLSLDPVNVQAGLITYTDYKTERNNLQICYMNSENDFPEHVGRALQIAEGRNQIRKMLGGSERPLQACSIDAMRVCPVDAGKLDLESGCAKCKKCIDPTGAKPVWFRT